MITAQGDEPWMVFSINRQRSQSTSGDGIIAKSRVGLTLEKSLVSILDLLDGIFVVVGRDGNVTTVDKLEPGAEWIDCKRDIVSAIESQTTRASTNPSRTESSTGAVRGGCVLKHG